jgi:DNA modification methylase
MDIRIEDALRVDYSKIDYDMVFTSPPYYDLEIYGDSRKSIYDTKEKWDNEFYRPLFETTYRHLAKDGHYCLNIPNDIFERVCLQLLGTPAKQIPLKKSHRRATSSQKYTEYVYVWVKV